MAGARIGVVLAAGALAASALVASPASPRPDSPHAKQRPLLGVIRTSRAFLVRVDPRTLQPLPGRRISVGPHLHGWASSPDGSLLAYSPHPGGVVHIVDAKTLQPRGKIAFPDNGLAAWVAPRRLLWIGSELALVDSGTGRRLLSKRIGGQVLAGVREGDRVALLIAPAAGVGPSRLLVVDAAGSVRSIGLARIRSGSSRCGGRPTQPGLALDPAQTHVFIVGAESLVAEVDLATLAVSYHALEPVSPPPLADVCESRSLTARWLGNGLIAVSGFDRRQVTDVGGRPYARYDPAGLSLIDVRSWSTRILDENADSFRLAEHQLLATGIRWDKSASGTIGMGLASYALDGTKRFHLFEEKHAWVVEAYAGRAYVGFERGRVAVVDLETGAVVGERSTPVPGLLVDDGVSLFGRR